MALKDHATVKLNGAEIPLIGIPTSAVTEVCDCCGDDCGLSEAIFTGTQILCEKCNRE